MASEFSKPMLDIGAPRVLNVNALTRRIRATTPEAAGFFRNKPLNGMVIIKDTLPEDLRQSTASPIGTKLYFPFNENEVYEGGRTIFASDRHLAAALTQQFGEGAISKDALAEDMRILRVLDQLPSLDPFLLKDVFIKEKIQADPGYFEADKEIWQQIENFLMQRFEAVVSAAFPQAMESHEKAHALIEKIWEARDMEVLGPLVMALRLPASEATNIFTAWKGICYYAFQFERIKPQFDACLLWFKDTKIPVAAVSGQERDEYKAMLEQARINLAKEWQKAAAILHTYQESYDKLFVHKSSPTEFIAFLKDSSKHYWDLGNSIGRTGHIVYCWDIMTKRFTERRLPWEQLRELIILAAKIFPAEKKAATAVAW